MFVRRMEQSPPPWKKTLRYAALTDVGLRRANNQDSHAVVAAGTDARWNDRGHLFVVADGMGAHAAGEVASKFATETITQSYLRRKNELPHQAIAGAVYDAHRFIREKSAQEEAFRDMGTTVDALLILPQGALIAHVGDSRVYRLRGQVLEQMTFDHEPIPILGGCWVESADGKRQINADWQSRTQEVADTLADRLLELL